VRSVLLDEPGAVPAPEGDPDEGVAWHFGDPFAEQRAAAREAAVIDRSNREVLAVPGEDRLTWMHLLTSQHFTEVADGRGGEALILDAHGHIEQHLVFSDSGGTVYADTEPGKMETLLPYLDSMRFWYGVDPRDVTEDLAVLSVLGPRAEQVCGAVTGVELPDEEYATVALPGGSLARRMPWPGAAAVDLLVPRGELAGWWHALTTAGARASGSWTFEALRVESLHARLDTDTDSRAIPHEMNWVPSAVHLDKGCYRGQETVSKVHNIGKPPRRMVLLHLDGSPEVLPLPGDPVAAGERTVGRVGSVVQHHELGPVALALLKRSAKVTDELTAGVEDRVVQAKVDPDSLRADIGGEGREAAARLRSGA
jgi:folate-binding protein YgfZ